MNKQLFISDLDWTLLTNATLSSFSRESLKKIFKDYEVNFTVASARSLVTMKEILTDVPFRLPVIQLNGAVITDYHSQEDFLKVALETEKVEIVFEILKDFKANYLVTGISQRKMVCFFPMKRNEMTEVFYQERISRNDPRIHLYDSSAHLDCEVLSLTLIEPHEKSLEINKIITGELKDSLQIYPMGVDESGWEWTTFQAKGATKGDAVSSLCKLFDFRLEEASCFGDNVNDVSMIQKAGNGIAVENAIDELKRHAQKVIGHCNDDSVVKYILDQY